MNFFQNMFCKKFCIYYVININNIVEEFLFLLNFISRNFDRWAKEEIVSKIK